MMVASRNYADFASEATFEIKVKQLNTSYWHSVQSLVVDLDMMNLPPYLFN